MPRLTYYPVGESFLWAVLAALVLMGLLAIGPGRSRLSRGRRVVLVGLRVVAIAMIVLAMLRPTLIYTRVVKQSATLLVMIDVTGSMSVADGVDGATRWGQLQETLADAQEALADLAEDFEVQAYAFDSQARQVTVDGGTITLPETPEGHETAIGASLLKALQQQTTKRLLGVILLSDGVQNAYLAPRNASPDLAAAQLKHLGYSMYTIAFGQPHGRGQAKDVRIENLLVNPTVFEKNELTVEAELHVNGYLNREIAVQLLFETPSGFDEVTRSYVATDEKKPVPVRFTYIPETAGEFKLTVKVDPQPGELVTTNNRLDTFVNVLGGGLNVLYLEGTWRVEQKFLRRALDASPDIQVDYFRIDAEDHSTRPGTLAEMFEPGKYDVYILGDLDAEAFQTRKSIATQKPLTGEDFPMLARLAEAVHQDAGLIMLGGFHSFGPGGYAQTSLADALPVTMDRLERQQFDKAIRPDVHVSHPLKMRPSLYGRTLSTLALAGAGEDNEALWAKLPPLDGANRFSISALSQGATVLADAGPRVPLLVEHFYGGGRVMAFAGDSTWRWWMRGYESAHKRFWRQIVLRLAQRDESGDGNAWIRPSKPSRRYAPGEQITFVMGARSATGEPIDDATYEVSVVLPEQEEPRRLRPPVGGEQMTTTFRDTEAPGDYRVELTVTHPDLPEGTARAKARFLVYEQNLELDNAAADSGMLKKLATDTGGKLLAPEQLPGLLRELAQNTESLDIEQEKKVTFWDTWPFFLLMVALLGVEWFLRKRWGLV